MSETSKPCATGVTRSSKFWVRSSENLELFPVSTIPREVPGNVTLEVWPKGGHLGFVEGPMWRPRYYAERRAVEFLAAHLG